jgi:hypothetical protein
VELACIYNHPLNSDGPTQLAESDCLPRDRLLKTAKKVNDNEAESLLPLLRWAGSKKRQFSSFQKFFPTSYKKYVEPFAGSAAFFFCLRPKIARLTLVR